MTAIPLRALRARTPGGMGNQSQFIRRPRAQLVEEKCRTKSCMTKTGPNSDSFHVF